MIDVSVIIVHFNTPLLTRNCIKSIIEKTVGITYEIIVVDNASTVHNAQELQEEFTFIRLFKSKSNLGFAGGNNFGIRHAVGKYVLLLNSDTTLINNAIGLAFNYLETHSRAGVLSAQLQYPDGRIQSACQRFPSVKYSLIELLRLQKLMPKRSRGKLLLGAFFDHESALKADWVWGTFFMFPQKILQELPSGKLDDRYFMYAEDIQWCLDIKKLGYEIHYYPEAKVTHFMGGSSGKKNELMEKNNRKFLEDNFCPFKVKLITILQKALVKNED